MSKTLIIYLLFIVGLVLLAVFYPGMTTQV
jgi:hypothetical protein